MTFAKPPVSQRWTPIAFWVISGLIICGLAGYLIWDHLPDSLKTIAAQNDPVTDAAPKSQTIVELRNAYNRLKAPDNEKLMYGQAVGNGEIRLTVEPFIDVDASKLTADQFALPLPQMLAIDKASEFNDWQKLQFDGTSYRNGKPFSVHAEYSQATLKGMNLSKFTSTQAIFEAADNHHVDAGLAWTGKAAPTDWTNR